MALILAGAAGCCAAVGGGGYYAYTIRPKDPVFEVKNVALKGLKLRWKTDLTVPIAVIDVQLVLSIQVVNPNIVPIEYTSTVMDIYYKDNLLGQATVDEGNQGAQSTKVLEIPAKLDGLEMTSHVKSLFKDVANRKMSMSATVTIAGHAVFWKWTHNFEVHVTSDITVDPIFLNVIEQENRVQMELAAPI